MLLNKQLESYLREHYKENFESFIEWSKTPLRPVIRVNTLKANIQDVYKRLSKKGFILSRIEYINFAFRVEYYPYEIGNTLEHYLGYIYVQEISSMLPAIFLEPKSGEIILDLCSAPGSKTTLISQIMNNKGVIIANDADINRTSALAFNIDRMGCLNVIITQYKGEYFYKYYGNYFDKVLVDAPCSAIGTIHKNKEIIKWWSYKKVNKFSNLQKKLIESGFLCLKENGTLIYSTCTITREENEDVVNYLLRKYKNAKVEKIELPFKDYYPDSLNYGIYINFGEYEPFYICKIRKI
ncbi:MAG: RsmB/NOP family class I SAM-dependent RNA methyltransferase [candidate division WOR-3 bacterium]